MYSSMGVSLSRTAFCAWVGKPANPLLSCKAGPKGWWRLSLIYRCFLVPMLFVTGCASDGQGPYWGEEATLSPGWNRIGSAAVEAARDPVTWAPALGAGEHHLADVLAGLALGNFVAAFATEAFLEPASGATARLQVRSLRGGLALNVDWSF